MIRVFFSPSSLAVIEQLPMDLRDRFTEMREMDLQVQSTALLQRDASKQLFPQHLLKLTHIKSVNAMNVAN